MYIYGETIRVLIVWRRSGGMGCSGLCPSHGLCVVLELWLSPGACRAGVGIGGGNFGVGYCNVCQGVYCQG